jgi:predicted lactoylglutathione lyase
MSSAHKYLLTGIIILLTLSKVSAQGMTTAKTEKIMDQRLTFITIGAKDLGKLKQFYIDKFGWKPLKDDQNIVFFKMNGFILGLYPLDELAKDANAESNSNNLKGVSFSINYDSKKQVDEVFSMLQHRGVQVVKQPEKAFWGGYSGYVIDVEGNHWEIAYNPYLVMDKDHNVVTHR